MNATETREMWRACCHCCTIADNMKPCLDPDPDCDTWQFEQTDTKPHIRLDLMTRLLVTLPATVADATDLGTHTVISGGEVLELDSHLEARYEEESELPL